MQTIKQNETIATKKRIAFTTVRASNWDDRLDASQLVMSVEVIKADGSHPAGGGIITQPDGATAKHVCHYTPGGTDLDTPGPLVVIVTDATMEPREIEVLVEEAFLATAVNGTLTAIAFTTDRTEGVNDHWKDALVRARDGANAGQVKKIGAYDGATKKITLATVNGSQLAFTAAPANGDHFEIITR